MLSGLWEACGNGRNRDRRSDSLSNFKRGFMVRVGVNGGNTAKLADRPLKPTSCWVKRRAWRSIPLDKVSRFGFLFRLIRSARPAAAVTRAEP